jgi:hypothetical protein
METYIQKVMCRKTSLRIHTKVSWIRNTVLNTCLSARPYRKQHLTSFQEGCWTLNLKLFADVADIRVYLLDEGRYGLSQLKSLDNCNFMYGSGSFHQVKKVRKNLDSYYFVTSL